MTRCRMCGRMTVRGSDDGEGCRLCKSWKVKTTPSAQSNRWAWAGWLARYAHAPAPLCRFINSETCTHARCAKSSSTLAARQYPPAWTSLLVLARPLLARLQRKGMCVGVLYTKIGLESQTGKACAQACAAPGGWAASKGSCVCVCVCLKSVFVFFNSTRPNIKYKSTV